MKFSVEEKNRKLAGIYIIRNSVHKIVYVGSTVLFHKRFVAHMNQLKKGNHFCSRLQRFVNKHGINTLTFSILEVVENPTKESLLDREAHYFLIFPNKFNSCPTPYSMLGFRFSEDHKIRNRLLIKEAKSDPAQRQAQSDHAKKMWQDPDFRERRMKAHLPTITNPEYKERMAEHMRQRWKDPEYKARVLASKLLAARSDSCREKQRQNNLGEKNRNGKYTEDQVRRVKLLVAERHTQGYISRETGVSIKSVKDIRSGKTWSHLEI